MNPFNDDTIFIITLAILAMIIFFIINSNEESIGLSLTFQNVKAQLDNYRNYNPVNYFKVVSANSEKREGNSDAVCNKLLETCKITSPQFNNTGEDATREDDISEKYLE